MTQVLLHLKKFSNILKFTTISNAWMAFVFGCTNHDSCSSLQIM